MLCMSKSLGFRLPDGGLDDKLKCYGRLDDKLNYGLAEGGAQSSDT